MVLKRRVLEIAWLKKILDAEKTVKKPERGEEHDETRHDDAGGDSEHSFFEVEI